VPSVPLVTSAATDALAYTLASLRGLTPDEAVASALRAELERQHLGGLQPGAAQQEPAVEDIMARILSLGPWHGPSGAKLTEELYDAEGLPR
jgi:hypothetical protein